MLVLASASRGLGSCVRIARSVLSFRLGDAAGGCGVVVAVGFAGAGPAGVGVADAEIVDGRVQVQLQVQVQPVLGFDVHHHAST
jgi:hypothetical protein